ncbi:hypothetical protein SAMN05421810_105291 [Amycolatopsis arida]|uniref:SH3 domain-containing protein n=1 Tax=Amycolatopsis arida TaxID=587909 RepID=A0A1I5WUV2_9PSEU|nr:hypothetical protein [Amycolatopsis arida]TDX92465.1 hypothetical protein CLV69_105310 [Amycolatopsis arida]SFQ23542.1 hypothetical protein SAMN05421810_105291 [Amycolatopsis arida]
MSLGIPKRVIIVVALVAAVVLIYAMGADRRSSEGAEGGGANPGGPSGCRVAVTADILNVRAEPHLGAEIVGKYKQHAQADAEPVVENGFRKLAENRWAADEYLRPLDGTRCG